MKHMLGFVVCIWGIFSINVNYAQLQLPPETEFDEDFFFDGFSKDCQLGVAPSCVFHPTSTPTPIPYPTVSDVEKKAIVLAVIVEAGGRPDIERDVVMHVILNHESLPPGSREHWDIVEGTPAIADGVINGMRGRTREEQIEYAHDFWYAGRVNNPDAPWYPQPRIYFEDVQQYVNEFLASPPPDFTQGAIRFAHYSSEGIAAHIATDMQVCGDWHPISGDPRSELELRLSRVGISPFVNNPDGTVVVENRGGTIFYNTNNNLIGVNTETFDYCADNLN